MERYDELKKIVDLYSKSFDKRIVFGEVLSRLENSVGKVDFYIKEGVYLDLGIPVKKLGNLSPFDVRRHLFKGDVVPGDYVYLYGNTYVILCSNKGDFYGLIELPRELFRGELEEVLSWIGVVSSSLEDMYERGKWEAELDIYHKLHRLGIDLGDLNKISKVEDYLKGFMGEGNVLREVEVVLDIEGIGVDGSCRENDSFVKSLVDKGKVCKLREEDLLVLEDNYRSGIAFLIKNDEKLMGYILVLSKEKDVMDSVEIKMWSAILSYLELLVSNLVLLESLRKEKMKDGLTGLYKREYLEEKVNDRLLKGLSGSLLILDIDDFKILNDTYGHLVGDDVLIRVSRVLEESVRKGDIVTRWGGEEFVVYLSEVSLEDSLVTAERLLGKVKNGSDPEVTLSCGLVHWKRGKLGDTGYEGLFKRADDLMYIAKKNGKNRVEYVEVDFR